MLYPRIWEHYEAISAHGHGGYLCAAIDSVTEVVNFVVSKWPIFPFPCSHQLVEAVTEVKSTGDRIFSNQASPHTIFHTVYLF